MRLLIDINVLLDGALQRLAAPDALATLELPLIGIEDALQVAAAMACGAQFIVTRNERDFRKSPVPTLSPWRFASAGSRWHWMLPCWATEMGSGMG